MRTPLVSVIMPMYNGLPFVKDAISSILGQSFRDFELLVVDNGSTDGSLQYVSSLADPRARVLSERQRGAGRALTAGIYAGRGEFLAVMDADDIAHQDRLRTEMAFLQANPEIVLVGSRFAFLVGSTIVPVPPQPREQHEIKRALLQRRPVICNSSTMFRANEAKAVGGHRLPGPGHDVDFFLRMSEVGRITNIPDVLHYIRVHGGSTSIVKMREVNCYVAFSVACAKARSSGRQEPDYQNFKLQWRHRPMIARLSELADCRSLELYRAAVVKRAKKQFLTSAIAAICAACLSPSRTSWHLRRKLGLCS